MFKTGSFMVISRSSTRVCSNIRSPSKSNWRKRELIFHQFSWNLFKIFGLDDIMVKYETWSSWFKKLCSLLREKSSIVKSKHTEYIVMYLGPYLAVHLTVLSKLLESVYQCHWVDFCQKNGSNNVTLLSNCPKTTLSGNLLSHMCNVNVLYVLFMKCATLSVN